MTTENEEQEPSSNVIRMRELGRKSGESRKALSAAAGPKAEDHKARWQMLLDGDITVEDLDDEELLQMRGRDRLGGFTGRPPKAVPRKLAQAMRQEMLKRGQADLENALPIAVKALIEVATKSLPKDRIAAAQLLLERGLGKVADKVDITNHAAEPWDDILEGITSDAAYDRARKAAGE